MSSLLAIPALPLLAAAVLPFAGILGRSGLALVSAAVAVAVLGLTAALAGPVLGGGAATASVPWMPAFGLAVSLRLDGLALLFVLLIAGIGLLVVVYARWYLGAHEALPRFYASLLLFMAAMLGVVLADNLLLLVVFWELTSIASFLLIGFWDERADARAGAWQSLMVTGMGGLALLAGVLVLGAAAGTFELGPLRDRAVQVRGLPAAPIALALMLVGACTKSAQVPFHFWLPSAMAAPTPVSAYLHSATMVKAGVFLLARLWPIFAPLALWQHALPVIGGATMLAGGWIALRHTDLKRILAYSTVSQLGFIALLYGLGTPEAAVAATLHVLCHAAFKAPLFLVAGIVDHECGSRDLARVSGLRTALPETAALAIVAAAAMAGVAPLSGFVSKEMGLEALLHGGRPVWPLVALAGSVFTTAYALRFVVGAFFGPVRFGEAHHAPHEPPLGMRVPVYLLAAFCVAAGVAPALVMGPLVAAAAGAVTGAPVTTHLALWHGPTAALGLSLAALAGGTAWYVARRATARTVLPVWLGRTASARYDATVKGVLSVAGRITDGIQTGVLRRYVLVVLCFLVLLVAAGLPFGPAGPAAEPPTPIPAGATTLAVVTIASAIAVAVLWRQRWPAVLALGATGLLVAVYFVWLGAPDLVLTQVLVEAVTTILLVLVLYFLPKATRLPEPRRRVVFDAAFALALGCGAAAVVYGVMRRPFSSISGYHLARSLPDAGGGNVVNVILVDFRGYDTMGEITVLAIAALGVVALVQAARRRAA
ncbi:MAG: DUF4040 domain-containing protein [bacterium]|nr:DUF4040 domain-containing protein [bacterium]